MPVVSDRFRKIMTPLAVGEIKDYKFDLSNRLLNAETIDTFVLTADTGITVSAETNDDTTVTYWLTGGTVGVKYHFKVAMTTTGGRTFIAVQVVEVVDAYTI